ncbi:hypothetical protein A3Q56_07398 [Intoshia linei]|uniref:Dynein regulatory complex subunit 3 n=1 Tax=Intoshia linei TaxID=1819745 RepID=A0A177ASA6_9BILA|nr:hypothetical protein A3Q56_07398 [Intoshia linei]
MTQVDDPISPTVIDDELILKSVHENTEIGEAGRILEAEGIEINELETLRLEFKNILKVENIWSLKLITKLQLSNNIIEKIENLDHMVNLEWLDLSFNNIEEIENLENLVKLKDLTLFNNRIRNIENIQHFQKLQFFSIGNNFISDFNTIVNLRKLESLRSLNTSGNPISSDVNFKHYCISHIPQLTFLDYKLIHEIERNEAKEKYDILLMEIQQNELVEIKKNNEISEKQRLFAIDKMAYVENMNSEYYFIKLFIDDAEGIILNMIPGIEEILESYPL